MKQALSIGMFSGLLSALIVGVAEGFSGRGVLAVQAAALGALLLIPLGIGIGIALAIVPFLLQKGRRPKDWLRALSAADHPEAASKVLVWGIWSLAMTSVFYHIIYFFFTGFHHKGLAALALTAVLVALGSIAAAVGAACLRALPALLKFRPARRPVAAVILVTLLWGLAIIPPFIKGPEAGGVFGFIGLLAKDGLKAGPPVSLAAMGVLSIVFQGALSIKPDFISRKTARIFLGIAATFGMAALFVANLIAASMPSAVDRIDSAEGAAGLFAKIIRKIGDRDHDGHSRWMGGKDCNDRDPKIYPRAPEIPNNGMDEDCSGKDLNLAELMAEAGATKPSADADKTLQRPKLPEDVSLFLISIDTLRWNAAGFEFQHR